MFKKVAFVILGLFILVALTALSISVFYKKEVNNYIAATANKRLNARFSFKDVSIGLIKTFPRLGIEIEGVNIIGIHDFENDTLASIPTATIQIGITEYLFNDKVDIEKIKIEDANLNLIVLKNGRYNWDIIKTDSLEAKDTTQKEMHIALKKYTIENANIIYKDELRGVFTKLDKVSHSGSGDFTKEVFTLETTTRAEKLSLSYLGKPLLSEVAATLEAPIQMNFTKMEFAFKNNALVLNALPIRFDAWFAMPDTNIDMDIRFDAVKSPLKDFLSLVPVLYQNSYNDLTASGKFTLNGFVKGRMNDAQMPGFEIGLTIQEGAFKYASIPAGIKDVQLALKINNPDGIADHTVVDLSKLSLRLNNQFMQASMLVKTLQSNPYIKAKAKGDIDLGALLKIIPQKDLDLSGNIKMNLDIDGKVNEFKKGKGYAKGNFDISQLRYKNKNYNKPIQISSGNFVVTPQKLLVNKLFAVVGKSDFDVTGSLENYFLYFLKNEPISGRVNLVSKLTDLNELMDLSGAEDSSTNTQANSTFELPKNVNISATAKIAQIKYKDFLISEAEGVVGFSEQQLDFKKMAFNLLDATYTMNGVFEKQENKEPKTDLYFTIQNLDVKKAYKNFVVVQKFAPIAEAIQGKVNLNISFSTKLSNSLSPDLNTINSEGDIYINDANLKSAMVLNNIADLVKWPQLKSLAFKTAHLSYSIKNGRAIVKPFSVATNITTLNIGGSNGLDKSLDYIVGMDMPKQLIDLGGASGISKELAKINPNLSLDKIGKAIKMQVLITGNLDKPTLKLSLKGTGISGEGSAAPIIDQVKEVVTATIKQEVNNKLDQAQKEADSIILEAKIAADKIKKEAYDRADKMVEETKNPFAKVGVKLVADKIKKEADNKSNQIIETANQKAKDIINKAKSQ
jgi:vacuolar-type H+-ATPase subunit H